MLQERISSLKDKIDDLESEKEKFRNNNFELKEKVENLITENKKLRNKINDKNKQIDKLKKTNNANISEIEIKILKYLFENNKNNISPRTILNSIDTNTEINKQEHILYYLKKLEKKNMVASRKIAPFDDTNRKYWSIAQKGREYIINK